MQYYLDFARSSLWHRHPRLRSRLAALYRSAIRDGSLLIIALPPQLRSQRIARDFAPSATPLASRCSYSQQKPLLCSQLTPLHRDPTLFAARCSHLRYNPRIRSWLVAHHRGIIHASVRCSHSQHPKRPHSYLATHNPDPLSDSHRDSVFTTANFVRDSALGLLLVSAAPLVTPLLGS